MHYNFLTRWFNDLIKLSVMHDFILLYVLYNQQFIMEWGREKRGINAHLWALKSGFSTKICIKTAVCFQLPTFHEV